MSGGAALNCCCQSRPGAASACFLLGRCRSRWQLGSAASSLARPAPALVTPPAPPPPAPPICKQHTPHPRPHLGRPLPCPRQPLLQLLAGHPALQLLQRSAGQGRASHQPSARTHGENRRAGKPSGQQQRGRPALPLPQGNSPPAPPPPPPVRSQQQQNNPNLQPPPRPTPRTCAVCPPTSYIPTPPAHPPPHPTRLTPTHPPVAPPPRTHLRRPTRCPRLLLPAALLPRRLLPPLHCAWLALPHPQILIPPLQGVTVRVGQSAGCRGGPAAAAVVSCAEGRLGGGRVGRGPRPCGNGPDLLVSGAGGGWRGWVGVGGAKGTHYNP